MWFFIISKKCKKWRKSHGSAIIYKFFLSCICILIMRWCNKKREGLQKLWKKLSIVKASPLVFLVYSATSIKKCVLLHSYIFSYLSFFPVLIVNLIISSFFVAPNSPSSNTPAIWEPSEPEERLRQAILRDHEWCCGSADKCFYTGVFCSHLY